jgi:energy-coupling factor transporter ATP-binding protein EcfA2
MRPPRLTSASPPRSGPLRAGELAEGVVLADMSLALTVVGQLVPLGGILLAAAVVPFAIVAARHRVRAVVAGAIAASAVGFLVIGTAALTALVPCAAFGALIGTAERRGWRAPRIYATGILLLWPPAALIVDVALFLLSDLRHLVLVQIRNDWRGLFHLLSNLGLDGIAEHGDDIVTWIIRYWWISIPMFLFALTLGGIWLARGLATPALRRVNAAFGDHAPEGDSVAPSAAPSPVPVTLSDVSFRYRSAATEALRDVSLTIQPSEMVVFVGPNGSGKSTLARIIADRQPATSGRVDRPGAVGLGLPGGTAFVSQRPEAQVLGVGVRDDVVWGLRNPDEVDVDAVLDRVGLRALADRETATLSGGELQRLALAAALARRPALLLSDESTAMIDAEGRAQQMTLLRELATRDGVAVVHVSHDPAEAAVADRVIALADGRIVERPPAIARRDARRRTRATPGPVIIELDGVGHIYSRATPWANRALEDVGLVVREHEAVLVVGHNGSGKSTLAWIIAGLLHPSEGIVRVEGTVGLAFQHARLQLLRPTVLDEVRVAAHVDAIAARNALIAVGLDPLVFATKRIDELSGGQMRRVVLADALAARPRVILLDEPFAGLDAQGRQELEAVLAHIRASQGIALVIVAHDRDLPPGLVDRVVELDRGRIVRDDPAEEAVT